MLDCFLDYSVNPNLRFHSRIDKIIDDVIREKINIPHKFRMRLESRHCVESRIIYFRFRVLDKACLQCNVFLKGLSEEMKVEISYIFNASALGGKNLVTFEELYDFSNPDEPVKVAEHKDIEDDGQTVLITERIIKIHTTATDKDGNKELEAGKEVTIIDTVTLEGLEVGTQYKLVGWQMLKKENAELLINGKRVESDYTFTADSETMKVEVAFTLDATSLDGKQLVTFEELYDLSNPDDPKKVTEHKDIEDKGQTITFKEKPKEPEKPETPPTPEKPNRPSDSPKTGDNTNLYGLLALLLTSGAGLAGIFFYKRRKMKKS
jgi:LPXTG-motif cell wall-anchored protein